LASLFLAFVSSPVILLRKCLVSSCTEKTYKHKCSKIVTEEQKTILALLNLPRSTGRGVGPDRSHKLGWQ
jgi:hypothetical protein